MTASSITSRWHYSVEKIVSIVTPIGAWAVLLPVDRRLVARNARHLTCVEFQQQQQQNRGTALLGQALPVCEAKPSGYHCTGTCFVAHQRGPLAHTAAAEPPLPCDCWSGAFRVRRWRGSYVAKSWYSRPSGLAGLDT
jgi:hypothetical protein